MMLVCFILCLPIALYCVLLLTTAFLFKQKDVKLNQTSLKVSILIPCRNEEEHLAACLTCISKQTLDPDAFEVIVIDDHSKDTSVSIVNAFKEIKHLRLISSVGRGKKQALLSGIQTAQFPYILTTDADCTMGADWLKSMVNQVENENLKMLCGLIAFKSKSVFTALQQAESAAIVGLSAVSLNKGFPTTCNGANLLFEKEAFFALGGYGKEIELASGDDDLLMQKFFNTFGKDVCYSLDADALVKTDASSDFASFISQRKRWAGKYKFYKYKYNSMIQMLVFSQLIGVWSLLVYGLISGQMLCVLPVFFKLVCDWVYAKRLSTVFNIRKVLLLFMPFYQLYYFLVAFGWNKNQLEWKGRKVLGQHEN